MKKFKRKIYWCLLLAFPILSNTVNAQVQITPSGNILTDGKNAWGGGSLSGRYFISSNVAVGANLRFIPTTKLLSANIEADYFIKLSEYFKPFVGLEGGVYSDARLDPNYRRNTLGVAPKIGIQTRVSKLVGLQIEADLPIIVEKGTPFGQDSGLLLGLGLNFNLGSL